MDIYYNHHILNLSGHLNFLTEILKPIMDKIEMLEKPLIEVESSRLGDNPQAIILFDII